MDFGRENQTKSWVRKWFQLLVSLVLIVLILKFIVPFQDQIVVERKSKQKSIHGRLKNYDAEAETVTFTTKDTTKTYDVDQLKTFNERPYKKGLVSTWRELNTRIFLPFFLCFLFSILLISYRLKLLLQVQNIKIGTGSSIQYTWIGLFWNNLTLGLTGGDVVKAYLIGSHLDQKTDGVLTVFVDRFIGLFALILISLVASIGTWLMYGNQVVGILGLILFIAVFSLFGGSYLFFHPRFRSMGFVCWIKKRLPFEDYIRTADRALKRYLHHPKAILKAFGLSVLNHLVLILICWAYGLALGIQNAGISDYLTFYPPATVVSALPISAAGWGVGEISFTYLFGLANVAGALAVSLSVMIRLTMVLWSLPGGVMMNFTSEGDLQEQM